MISRDLDSPHPLPIDQRQKVGPLSVIRSLAAGRSAPFLVWLVSFGWFFWGSWRPAWSNDESATVVAVRQSASGLWRYIRLDPALGPYYLLLKPWAEVSTSHLWLRLPSVAAMALAVTVTFLLVRRSVDAVAGILAALAMVSLPMIARYGQDARPYAFALLACVIAVYAWWRLRVSGQRRYAAGLVVALVAAGLMHAYSLTIILPLVLMSVVMPYADRRRELAGLLFASGCGVLLLLPYFWYLLGHARGNPNSLNMSPVSIAKMWVKLPVFDVAPALALAFSAAVVGLAVLGTLAMWRGSPGTRPLVFVAVAWLLLPPLTLILVQLALSKPTLVYRYWLFVIPALAILVGLALWSLSHRSGTLAISASILLVVLAVPTQISIRQLDGHNGQAYLTIAQTMETDQFAHEPVLTNGAAYRSILANSPDDLAPRFPLIASVPGHPANVLFPKLLGTDSLQFQALAKQDTVLVFQALTVSSRQVPTKSTFLGSAAALEYFSKPLVLCSYFGHAVGVFAKPSVVATESEKQQMATVLAAPTPERIRCKVTP